MRINPVNLNTNFKGIIAPQDTKGKLVDGIFGPEAAIYEKITEKKDIDIVLLEYGSQRAFIIDRTKEDKKGVKKTYKELNSTEKGNFNKRLKEAIILTKADQNIAIASDLISHPEEVKAMGKSALPVISTLSKSSGSETSTWEIRLQTI